MRTIILAAAAAILTIPTALAQGQMPQPDAGTRQAFLQACGGDLKTYCSSATDRDTRRQCMRENFSKFSDTCKAELMQLRGRMRHDGGQGQTGGQ